MRILEVMRDMDLPPELLEDEDPSQTMPRRFGLSDVVGRQIREYRDDVKRKVRLTDEEIQGLFRFVIRRPDSPEVFREVGRLLADGRGSAGWVGVLPASARLKAARTRTRRALRRLFGRTVGGFAKGPFTIEGRALFFIETDPGGDACHLLSGLAEEILGGTVGGRVSVQHSKCQARGDALCRWEGELFGTAVRAAPAASSDPRDPQA